MLELMEKAAHREDDEMGGVWLWSRSWSSRIKGWQQSSWQVGLPVRAAVKQWDSSRAGSGLTSCADAENGEGKP